jgi:hypothetical protein
MDATRSAGDGPATESDDLRQAARRAMEAAALVADVASPDARLTVEIPLGRGEARVVLIEKERRISAWGGDVEEAMRRLIAKASG